MWEPSLEFPLLSSLSRCPLHLSIYLSLSLSRAFLSRSVCQSLSRRRGRTASSRAHSGKCDFKQRATEGGGSSCLVVVHSHNALCVLLARRPKTRATYRYVLVGASDHLHLHLGAKTLAECGVLVAIHADSTQLDDILGERNELKDLAKWHALKGPIQCRNNDSLSFVCHLLTEVYNVREKLPLVDPDDAVFHGLLPQFGELLARLCGGDLPVVSRDAVFTVAIILGIFDQHAIVVGDLKSLHTPNQLRRLSREHGSQDELDLPTAGYVLKNNIAGRNARHVGSKHCKCKQNKTNWWIPMYSALI
eukprot:Opistho-2@58326